ncbi:MAG TPA: C45 family peptidase [Candidatus Binataceae bacterium]|nr:C45 family peptidase [Candidatus Binataceae bacterium]
MQSFPVLHLTGSPREQGRAQGAELRKAIADVREQWRESLATRFGVHPDLFIRDLLAETKFLDAIKRWSPSLVDEIEGIAEGSGRPLDETIAFQCMDEEWWFGTMRYRKPAPPPDRCSIIAVRGAADRAPILAQNMDLRAYYDGGQVMINITTDRGPRASVMTICGMIGLCGANDHGLGVTVNTLWQLPSAADGLPVACVMREILARRDVAEASRWIREPRQASGQHYLIGDPNHFASFEASAISVNEVAWPDSTPSYAHTNHPLSGSKTRVLAAEENSRARYDTLCQRISDRTLTIHEVKSALTDRNGPHPISVKPEVSDPISPMTFASIVMELSKPPRIEMTGGPPCSNQFRAVAAR